MPDGILTLMNNKKGIFKKGVAFLLLAVFLAVFILWIAWGNRALTLTRYTLSSERLPKEFDGFTIAQVSDLHNAELGEENKTLLKMLKNAAPDLIAMTGDLVDSRKTDTEIALRFALEAAKIAPCYYVTGNHEARLTQAEYENLEQGLLNAGVTILHDREERITIGDSSISLIGIDDMRFTEKYGGTDTEMQASKIKALSSGGYTLLLSHRPEFFKSYVRAGVDLVLSGHAHGGQFRLPVIGGVFAPNQGLFPKYDSGVFTDGNTNMIVSRGIGNSLFPFRINNRPETVLIELKSI